MGRRSGGWTPPWGLATRYLTAADAALPHARSALQVAPRLQLLAGVPAGVKGWPWGLLQACRHRLRALHLHAAGTELRVGGAGWRQLGALRQLEATTAPYATVDVEALPPALRQLSVTSSNVFIDVPVLLSVPRVRLAAHEVYLIANTIENNETAEAAVLPLADLVHVLAAAGMPAGHAVELCTQVGWAGGRVRCTRG